MKMKSWLTGMTLGLTSVLANAAATDKPGLPFTLGQPLTLPACASTINVQQLCYADHTGQLISSSNRRAVRIYFPAGARPQFLTKESKSVDVVVIDGNLEQFTYPTDSAGDLERWMLQQFGVADSGDPFDAPLGLSKWNLPDGTRMMLLRSSQNSKGLLTVETPKARGGNEKIRGSF